MSNTTKQKCSICGAPDHTHLHCYGTDAQRPVSSKDESSFAFRFAKMWHDLIGSPVMNTRRYTEAQGMMEEADAEIARLRTEHEEFVLKVAERFRGSPVETSPGCQHEWIEIAGKRGVYRPSFFCPKCHKAIVAKYRVGDPVDCVYCGNLRGDTHADDCPRRTLSPATPLTEETIDQSRTVGEHQSGVALRSPDPANVAGGPRPLPEKASAPLCPWCGGDHVGADCKSEKSNAIT